MELVLLLNYCRCGTKHLLVIVSAELLLLSNYRRRGNMYVCDFVDVELLLSWS